MSKRSITSDRDIEKLKQKGKYPCGGGLYVRVDKQGVKSFRWRHRLVSTGPEKDHFIGMHGNGDGELKLKEARSRKDELKVLSKNDTSPLAVAKAIAADKTGNITFEELVDRYITFTRLKGIWAPATEKDYINKFNNQILPYLGKQRIHNITRAQCIEIKARREACGRHEQGARLFQLLRNCFEYAIDRELLPQDKLNPARSSSLTKSEHKVQHYPMLDIEDLRSLFKALNENRINQDWTSLLCIKVLMLTGLRVRACIPAHWKEIDFDSRVWIIPAERMKASDQDHGVPISDLLRDIFRRLYEENPSEYIFLSRIQTRTGHINLESPTKVLKKLGFNNPQSGSRMVAHSVRAMMLSYGQDVLKTPFHVIDLQLGHKPSGKVRQAYDRAAFWDERVAFMNQWSDWLASHGLTP